MAATESNSPTLPPVTSGTADSWSFDSASLSDTSEVIAEGTEGDQPAPDDSELLNQPPATPPAAPVVAPPPAQPGKKRQTISQRTEVLKADLAATLRERAQARAELDAIRAEVQRARPVTPGAPPAPDAPPRAPVSPSTGPASALGPKPTWDEYDADGKSWKEFEEAKDAWTEARIKHEVAQIEQRYRDDQERAARAENNRAYVAKLEAAQQKYPDFAAQVDANLAGVNTSPLMKAILVYHGAGAEVLYHWAKNPHEAEIISTLQPTRPVMDALRKAEDPIPLLSHFAAHRAWFEQLTQMPPAEQLYELGRLQERLAGARSSDPPSQSVRSSPRPPFRAMGGTAAAAGSDSESTGDDFADWVRAENRRQGVGGSGRR